MIRHCEERCSLHTWYTRDFNRILVRLVLSLYFFLVFMEEQVFSHRTALFEIPVPVGKRPKKDLQRLS